MKNQPLLAYSFDKECEWVIGCCLLICTSQSETLMLEITSKLAAIFFANIKPLVAILQ
jgi:hypothetical protein